MLTRNRFINSPLPNEAELRILFMNRKPQTIFDIGSCEGEDSIRYSKLFPDAKVYAFEPLPHNMEIIKRQLDEYGVKNVLAFQTALADEVGEADFFVSSGQPDEFTSKDDWDFGNKSSSLFPPHRNKREIFPWLEFSGAIKVPTTTLENFCAQQGIQEIDFVHIDVQGAELKVLSGAGDFIKQIRAIWMEVENIPLYEGQPLKHDVEAFMKKHGFVNVKGVGDEVSGDQFYVNISYLEKYPLVALKFSVKRVMEWVGRAVKDIRTRFLNFRGFKWMSRLFKSLLGRK
jgi:FkbM family methyltransferase